ncbi:hypothetical protein SXYLSMQ121_1482 [Staphylococcus xylosus]|nr:hypothetical protein SXYLSMQ121_1482 [Staphylococcus xylosus]
MIKKQSIRKQLNKKLFIWCTILLIKYKGVTTMITDIVNAIITIIQAIIAAIPK